MIRLLLYLSALVYCVYVLAAHSRVDISIGAGSLYSSEGFFDSRVPRIVAPGKDSAGLQFLNLSKFYHTFRYS